MTRCSNLPFLRNALELLRRLKAFPMYLKRPKRYRRVFRPKLDADSMAKNQRGWGRFNQCPIFPKEAGFSFANNMAILIPQMW